MVANIITSIRILSGIIILFIPVFSHSFYVLYLLAGFSDMIDGTIARKTGEATKFGEIFDSVADFIFFIACFVKIFPVIKATVYICVWIGLILSLKIVALIYDLTKNHKIISVHSILNKIAGALLFAFPFALRCPYIIYYEIALCIIATTAAAQELIIVGKSKNPSE